MTQNMFENMSEQSKKFYEPWTQLNKTILSNAEKMTELSFATMKNYSELGLEQMKKASEVDSSEAATEFTNSQAAMFNTVSQQMLKDAQNLTELSNNMRNDIMEAMSSFYGNANEQMKSAMQEATDKAAQTANEFTQSMTKATEEVMQAATTAAKTSAPKTAAKTTARKTATAK